jgi:hypothetical protein
MPPSVHGHAWTAPNRRASGGNGGRLGGSNVDTADKPKHDDNDQYQAENAAESGSAIPPITMVATKPPSTRITRTIICGGPVHRIISGLHDDDHM